MRDLGRKRTLLKTFEDKVCLVCGEATERYLRCYPYHNKIRHNIFRYGRKTEQRKEASTLIQQSVVICDHCIIDKEWDELKGPWTF